MRANQSRAIMAKKGEENSLVQRFLGMLKR